MKFGCFCHFLFIGKRGFFMRNNIIQVAAVVPDLKVGDVKYNSEQIVSLIRKLTD